MVIWFLVSFINGHIKRDIIVRPADIKGVPGDVLDHARLKFKHGRSYGPLQRMAYFGVFFHPVSADRADRADPEPGHECGLALAAGDIW